MKKFRTIVKEVEELESMTCDFCKKEVSPSELSVWRYNFLKGRGRELRGSIEICGDCIEEVADFYNIELTIIDAPFPF